MSTVERINLAPTAETVLRIYDEGGSAPDVNYAIALVAVANGRGHITLDRLSLTLNVKDEVS